MLGVVVVFSFLGNTNAIYSYSIRRDIVGQTQEEAWRVFDSETSKILAAIEDVPAVVALADAAAAHGRTAESQHPDRRYEKSGLRRARARALRRDHGDTGHSANTTESAGPDGSRGAALLVRRAARCLDRGASQTQFANDPAARVRRLCSRTSNGCEPSMKARCARRSIRPIPRTS